MFYKIFHFLIKPLVGSGIGNIKLLLWIYKTVLFRILPKRIVSVQGFQVNVVNDGKMSEISTQLLFKGVHEPLTTDLFKKILLPGDAVIDVGANIGYFSLLSSSIIGSSGKVFAFEPDVNNLKAFRNNVELNKFNNIMIHPVAVSDYQGSADLHLTKDEDAKHSLIKTAYHTNMVKVTVDTIDNLIDSKLPIKLIKTDTEGNDIAVLTGAKNTIMTNHNISVIVEFYPATGLPGVLAVDFWFLMRYMGLDKCYFVNDYSGDITLCNGILDIVHEYNKIKLGVNLLFRRNSL